MKDKRAKYKRKACFSFHFRAKTKSPRQTNDGSFVSVERIEGSPLGEPSKRFLSIRHFPTFPLSQLRL